MHTVQWKRIQVAKLLRLMIKQSTNKLEMYRMEDTHGDTIEISAIDRNHVRIVTDSTG